MRSHTKGIADREAWTEPIVTTNCSCLWYSLQWTLNLSQTLLIMDSIFLLFKVISCPLLSLYSSVILMYPLRNIPFFWVCGFAQCLSSCCLVTSVCLSLIWFIDLMGLYPERALCKPNFRKSVCQFISYFRVKTLPQPTPYYLNHLVWQAPLQLPLPLSARIWLTDRLRLTNSST